LEPTYLELTKAAEIWIDENRHQLDSDQIVLIAVGVQLFQHDLGGSQWGAGGGVESGEGLDGYL
jgi:hypothetical protein